MRNPLDTTATTLINNITCFQIPSLQSITNLYRKLLCHWNESLQTYVVCHFCYWPSCMPHQPFCIQSKIKDIRTESNQWCQRECCSKYLSIRKFRLTTIYSTPLQSTVGNFCSNRTESIFSIASECIPHLHPNTVIKFGCLL